MIKPANPIPSHAYEIGVKLNSIKDAESAKKIVLMSAMKINHRVALVVPCFNESSIILGNYNELRKLAKNYLEMHTILIVYVDDGSEDESWEIISHISSSDLLVFGVKLSRNFGHQAALMAGISQALKLEADCIITLDCDLQDDIRVIPKMLQIWEHGVEIVLGVRDERKYDTFFKRITAKIFYSFLLKIGCPLIPNHADFRLLGRSSSLQLLKQKNQFLFLRSEIVKMGFTKKIVFYARKIGLHAKNETRYSFKKMLGLAASALTSYSLMPLRLILPMGLIVAFVALTWMASIVFAAVFIGGTQPGWASIICVLLLGISLNIIAVGIVAEYLGRLYRQAVFVEHFIIEKTVGVNGLS